LDVVDPAAEVALRQVESLRSLAALAAVAAYRASDQRDVIDADVTRWAAMVQMEDDERAFVRLIYAFAEFRTIFYFRLSRGNPAGALAGRAVKGLLAPVPGLDLMTPEIGPGLFISHGQGTVLAGARIGANCHVHQGVTIGWDYRGERAPIIGDDVFIGAGAKVLGAITVGDGARIGANAVVTVDVPAGATAVGVPARLRAAPVAVPTVPAVG